MRLNELGALVVKGEVKRVLPSGVSVQGHTVPVRSDEFAFMVSKPSDKPAYPNGQRAGMRSAAAVAATQPENSSGDLTGTPDATNARIIKAYGTLTLSFEANQGQTDSTVKFMSRGSGYSLFLTRNEAVLCLQRPRGARGAATTRPDQQQSVGAPASTRSSDGFSAPSVRSADKKPEEEAVVSVKLVGSNPWPHVTGLDELPGKSNYFIGNDPAKWRTNVPTYGKVRYENVYSGIDLLYYGNQRQLEYDFIVAPGADPRAIRLAVEGEEKLRIDGQGDLVLKAKGSDLRLLQPVIYQECSGVRQWIGGNFVIQGGHQVSFEVARYDESKPLIIDPVLSYSTYLGGSTIDSGSGIAVDASGNAYVAGQTSSTDFPTKNALQTTFGGGTGSFGGGADAFVTKLNTAGSALVYSTYLGGSGEDVASGIAVDSSGSAYV
jgi:hypothetical protein